jgi:hypothetical protein
MTAEEWGSLTVIVQGGQTPRAENAVVQYFARLFGETAGEGRRVVYAEGLWDENKALNLLGTLRLDGRLSVAVFNERMPLNASTEVFARLGFQPPIGRLVRDQRHCSNQLGPARARRNPSPAKSVGRPELFVTLLTRRNSSTYSPVPYRVGSACEAVSSSPGPRYSTASAWAA